MSSDESLRLVGVEFGGGLRPGYEWEIDDESTKHQVAEAVKRVKEDHSEWFPINVQGPWILVVFWDREVGRPCVDCYYGALKYEIAKDHEDRISEFLPEDHPMRDD